MPCNFWLKGPLVQVLLYKHDLIFITSLQTAATFIESSNSSVFTSFSGQPWWLCRRILPSSRHSFDDTDSHSLPHVTDRHSLPHVMDSNKGSVSCEGLDVHSLLGDHFSNGSISRFDNSGNSGSYFWASCQNDDQYSPAAQRTCKQGEQCTYTMYL